MASFVGYTADIFGIRSVGKIMGGDENRAAKGVRSCKVLETGRRFQRPNDASSRMPRLREIVSNLFSLASGFGGLGLFVLTILDASFLFIPFGPDLLLIALVAKEHNLAPLFALIATAGSVAGCAIVDAVSRKGGEKGLERLLSPRRIQSVAKRVRRSAPWALSIASVMPPPFPFTPIIIAASALQYPRRKLLTVVGIARLARYSAEAILGLYFGHQLAEISGSKGVDVVVIGLIVISIAGSAVTSYKWIKRRKRSAQSNS
jgi:membrane protein YqaA with SNARE-associated domain